MIPVSSNSFQLLNIATSVIKVGTLKYKPQDELFILHRRIVCKQNDYRNFSWHSMGSEFVFIADEWLNKPLSTLRAYLSIKNDHQMISTSGPTKYNKLKIK